MVEDSSGDGLVTVPGEEPLFRVGSAEQRLESLIHSLLLVLGAFLLAGVFIGLTDGILQSVGLGSDSAPIVSELLLTGMNFVGLLLAVFGYLYWRSDWSLIGFRKPTRRDIGVIAGGSILLVGFMMVAELVLSQIGLQPNENVAVEVGRQNPDLFLYYLPLVILLNAPAEELLFRGVVQGLFRRAYGVVPGILAAGAIFGLIHFVALTGEGSALVYVGIAVLSGVILGALYEYTQNIVVPTVVHALWNVLVYSTLYLETTGAM